MIKILFITLTISLLLFVHCGGGTRTLRIDVHSDENANSGNAVVVTIYQLINADKFRFASFESLMKKPEETLGSDIMPNSKYERTLVPGEIFQLKEHEIKSDAAYLGVIADFHSPAKDGWQQIISLDSDFDQLKISIHENSLSFEIN